MSFCLLGILVLMTGLTWGAAAACRSFDWWAASVFLIKDAQDMFLAAIISLVVLLLLESSIKGSKQRGRRRPAKQMLKYR